MTIYVVAYDLVNEKNGSYDYEPLWDELKRLNAHRVQYSLWLVNLNNSPREVADHFYQYMDSDDRIWVSAVSANEYTYKNAKLGTKKWLEKNPPG